jgi:hypothetical protein
VPANNITKSVDRLALYLARVQDNLRRGDRSEALANLAELAEIARRLWKELAEIKPITPKGAEIGRSPNACEPIIKKRKQVGYFLGQLASETPRFY